MVDRGSASTLAVQCALTASSPHTHVEFATLSGRAFATKAFSVKAITLDEPLCLYDLQQVRRKSKRRHTTCSEQNMEVVVSGAASLGTLQDGSARSLSAGALPALTWHSGLRQHAAATQRWQQPATAQLWLILVPLKISRQSCRLLRYPTMVGS